MNIATKRKCANRLGRAGLSSLAIEMVDSFDGSYKGVIELAGKLSVISQAATFDEYWDEQSQRGVSKAEALLEFRSKEQ